MPNGRQLPPPLFYKQKDILEAKNKKVSRMSSQKKDRQASKMHTSSFIEDTQGGPYLSLMETPGRCHRLCPGPQGKEAHVPPVPPRAKTPSAALLTGIGPLSSDTPVGTGFSLPTPVSWELGMSCYRTFRWLPRRVEEKGKFTRWE